MLKKILLSIGIAFVIIPFVALGHGGVEKHVGSVLVFLNQSPLSPLVGEAVHFNFSFSDREFKKVFANMPVTLTLIDTFYGDESKDTTLLSKEVITDVNGTIDFTYAFPKENYFDIELSFTDPATSEKEDVGFLIQPRALQNQGKNIGSSPLIYSLFGFLLGGMAYATIVRSRK